MNNTRNTLFFPITTPFDAIYRKNKINSPVGAHSHDGAELYYTLSDLPDVLIDDRIFAVPAGTLIVIPPFCVHQLYHESYTTYERYIVNINASWLKNVFYAQESPITNLIEGAEPLLLSPSSELENKWTQNVLQLNNFKTCTTPEAFSCLFNLLALLVKIAKTHTQNKSGSFYISTGQHRTNEIIAYINNHIYDKLTVNELAAHFYLNPDYLSRIFKKHAHISVSRYISLQKTATAQSLLREGHTVAWVQEKLGYSSYSHFFKSFQKNTGLSPSKYRDRYQ